MRQTLHQRLKDAEDRNDWFLNKVVTPGHRLFDEIKFIHPGDNLADKIRHLIDVYMGRKTPDQIKNAAEEERNPPVPPLDPTTEEAAQELLAENAALAIELDLTKQEVLRLQRECSSMWKQNEALFKTATPAQRKVAALAREPNPVKEAA